MSIDERLEFLVQSTESLHANVQELHAIVAEQGRQAEARMARWDAREKQGRQAILRAMEAYLKALDEEEGDE